MAHSFLRQAGFGSAVCFSILIWYRCLSGTTTDGYKAFAKQQKFEPKIVELEDGAFGCFLGPESATTTVIWFHGMSLEGSR